MNKFFELFANINKLELTISKDMQAQQSQRFKFLAGSSTWSQKKFECVDPHIAQEQDAVTSNGVFTALPWKANSSIAVFPAYGFRRFDNNIHLIKGHTGAITDVAFSPFVDQLLGSTSEDGTTKLWVIPEGGITDHVKEWDAELKGHTHKVLGLQWHRSVDNTLATHAADSTVRIWDVENQKSTISFTSLSSSCTAMRWSPDGKKITVAQKGGEIKSFDPRQSGEANSTLTHTGPKAVKLAYIDDSFIITSGFNKQAEREFAVWDTRNLSSKIAGGYLGNGLGVGHLYFDEQHQLLFSAGRGEQQIGIWQYSSTNPQALTFLSNYMGAAPQKGCGILPKQALDPETHEVERFVRMDNKGFIEYISFRLPNRTGQFQNDLYPPFQSNTFSSDYAEWASGVDKPVITMQLHQGMEDVELHSQKKSTFLAKIKPKGSQPVEKAPVVHVNTAQLEAKINTLEQALQKLTLENEALKVPQPTHNLNLKSKPTLGYWNIRGLGAQIRYLFYYLGIEFEDKLYAAGPAPDFDRSQWLNEKFTLGLDFPNLPYLIDESVKVTETAAIMKYICSKWRPELLGSDPATLASVEMLWAYVAKLKEEATAPCYQGKSNQEIMDVCFPLIEQLVTFMGDKQWITGSDLTWLDFMFFELVNLLDFLSGGVVKTHYETLGAYCSRFESLPNFSEAWKDDTLTIKWPWNGDMATIGGRGIAE